MIKGDVIFHKGMDLDNETISLCENKAHSHKKKKLGDEVNCTGQRKMFL